MFLMPVIGFNKDFFFISQKVKLSELIINNKIQIFIRNT